MTLMFSVAAPEGLRPDPDESSAPIATLDPSDVVSVDKTLDPWTKVTLTKAGLPLAGWIISADSFRCSRRPSGCLTSRWATSCKR